MTENQDINSVTKEKALETASFLVAKHYDFLNKLKLQTGNYGLDKLAVKDVARRYAYDVYRLHRYHDTEYIDRHKIAGYLTYWICRLRPIYIKNPEICFENAKSPLFINEAFALYVSVGRINAHLSSGGPGKRIVVSDGFLDAFLYGLRYRTMTGDMLSVAYYMAEKGCGR